jgi:arsenate reductase
MNKVYFLSTCSTCQKIISELGELLDGFEMQDIKAEIISKDQLRDMKILSGTYEGLFSKRAMKYKSLDLGEKKLTEEDYERLILEEYTFLKRPVFMVKDKIFVGNSKKNIDLLRIELES